MPFFKDYNKETKDLLTKNTAEGKKAAPGQFPSAIGKVESKLKPSSSTPIVINPVGDEKGVSANLEFIVSQVPGLKGKMTLKPETCAKPTFTYEFSGKKVEASLDSFKSLGGYEVTFEDKQKAYALIAKLDSKKVNAEASAPVAAGVEAGVSVDYALAEKRVSWSAGARYQCCKNTVVNVTTAAGAKFTLGATSPIPGFELAGKNVSAAVQVDFDRVKSSFDLVAGVAGQLPGCPMNSSFKFKINKNLAMNFAHFVELAGWKVASTFDVKERKVGVVLTRE